MQINQKLLEGISKGGDSKKEKSENDQENSDQNEISDVLSESLNEKNLSEITQQTAILLREGKELGINNEL